MYIGGMPTAPAEGDKIREAGNTIGGAIEDGGSKARCNQTANIWISFKATLQIRSKEAMSRYGSRTVEKELRLTSSWKRIPFAFSPSDRGG